MSSASLSRALNPGAGPAPSLSQAGAVTEPEIPAVGLGKAGQGWYLCSWGSSAGNLFGLGKKGFNQAPTTDLKQGKLSLTQGSDLFEVWVPLGELLLSP